MSKLVQSASLEAEDESKHSPQQGLNLSPFIRTAKRKVLLIGAITALATGFFAYKDSKKNPVAQYLGGFQLLTEPVTLEEKSSDPNALVNSNGVPNDRLSAVDYPTMLRILKSPGILSKIAERVQTEYPEFEVSQLNQNLEVERINDSGNRLEASKILAIRYTDADPKLVQLVLETTAQEYLNYSLNSRKQGIEKGIQFIERQLPKLNQQVSKDMDKIQELQERHQIVQANTKGEALLENVRQAEFEQRETQKEIEEQTQIVSNLESQLKISTEEAIAIAALRENPNFQSLVRRYEEKESELAIASAKFNNNSPQMIDLREEKQKIRDLLDRETQKTLIDEKLSQRASRLLVLDDQNSILLDLISQLVEAANRLDTLQARQQAVTRNLEQFQSQAQAFPEISRKYQNLQRELEIANRTKEQLSVQKDKLQIQASQTETPWAIVSQPQVMQDSSGNPRPLPTDSQSNVLKGLIGGLFVGTAAAILMEKIRDVFYSPEDVADITESSILGEIPFNKELSTAADSSFYKKYSSNDRKVNIDESERHKNFVEPTYDTIEFVNAFEQLYANIYLRYRDKSIKSIAVSSPSAGDGKSTVALYLARAIAADGKRVLLVDASSSSHRLAGNSNTNPRIEENIHIFVASPETLNSSSVRAKLMNDFNDRYEYIIYDVPSILNSVTARFLSINTDGILLITAIKKTKKSSLVEVLGQIKTLNMPLLGIVANNAASKQPQIEPNEFISNKLLKPSSDRASSNTESDSRSSDNFSASNKGKSYTNKH